MLAPVTSLTQRLEANVNFTTTRIDQHYNHDTYCVCVCVCEGVVIVILQHPSTLPTRQIVQQEKNKL